MGDKQDKAARLAEKLRENLRKRKAQARDQQAGRPQPHRCDEESAD